MGLKLPPSSWRDPSGKAARSPLLVIIAIHVLSECINQDVSSGLIQGVTLPETNLQRVQTFYADDTDLIVKADLCNILHCQQLFYSFGQASGLFCDWSKTKVALIPYSPFTDLISIPFQARALAGLIILWALHDGAQPLHQLLQFQIRAFSAGRWNTFDFSWGFNHYNTTPQSGSVMWKNICVAWNVQKRNIQPCFPDNYEGWNDLPLWQPHIIHHAQVLPRIPGISLGKFAAAGLQSMGDMMHPDGSFETWHGEVDRILPGYCRQLFEKLANILHSECLLNHERCKLKSLFLEYTLQNSHCVVLEFHLPREEHSRRWRPNAAAPRPYKSSLLLMGCFFLHSHSRCQSLRCPPKFSQ